MKLCLWAVLLFAALPLFADGDPGDLDREVEMAIQNLDNYSRGMDLGQEAGTRFFEDYFVHDCTFLTLNSWEVKYWLDYVDTVLTRPNPIPMYDHGYIAGWIIGYVNAYHQANGPCQDELNENVKQALAARIATCKALAKKATQTLKFDSMVDLIPANRLREEEARNLLGLVYFGSRSDAWAQLKAYDTEFVSALPCVSVMVDTVENLVKERISRK